MGITFSDPDVDSDVDTVSWAAVVRASGFDAFVATPSSANFATLVTDETGSGLLVFATSPSLTTPLLGTPTSGNLANCTGFPTGSLSGLGTGVATALAINVGSAGAVVVLNGALGTPSSGTLSSCTALPVSTGISGLGTSVATALAVNVGTAGAFVVNGGALGTPSSGTLSSCTGLPISTGVSGLGSNVAAWLADPTSAKLAAAVTNETGSGLLVFDTSPALTTPTIAGATLSGTIAMGTSTVTGTPNFTGGPNFSINANPITLTGGQGLTYHGDFFHEASSPYDILHIRQRGGAGGWSGAIEFSTNTSAGALTTQLRIRNNGGVPFIDVPNGTFSAPVTTSSETSGTLTVASSNKQVVMGGDCTINDGVHATGDRIEFYAGGSARSITQDTGMTLRLDGTATTGTRSLAARGRASVYFVSNSEAIVSGMGVT